MLKNPQICNTWIYRELAPTWVRQTRSSALDCAYPGYGRPGVELWTGSNMGSSDLDFVLETGRPRIGLLF